MHARCEAARAAASLGVHLRHADVCLRCQAEMARQRRLQRQLNDLRTLGPAAPSALVERILAGVEGPAAGRRQARRAGPSGPRRKVAYLTAGAGGAAVVAAALVGTRSRARRVRVAG